MKAQLTLVSLIPVLLTSACLLWLVWRWLKASDEPGILLLRLVVSVLVLGFVLGTAARARDEFSKIAAILVGAVGGLIMTIIWRQKFCDFFGDMFASLYTGGSEPPEPKPFYSIAEGRRKRGQYQEAIAEVQRQLALFPTDVTGWMLLAEIQAEDLKDLAAADATVEQFLAQPDHAPRNIAFALSRQADWRLKVAQDRDGARAALERIVELLPETEQAQNALQRIAHLTPAEMLLGRQQPHRISVPHQQENLGLRQEPLPKPAEEDPAVTAAQYVKHLDEFPFDNEAREKLALVYARHYQRLDLATDQLEQLISVPNQPAKLVVRWLNQIADLQLELASAEAQARETLQRIIELYPKTAAAETARNRLAHLKLEMRPKQVSQAVKLGSYEQNLGLRERPAEPQAE